MLLDIGSLLASLPSPPISGFDLGPLRINFYSLCLMTGIIAATALTNRRLTARGAEPGLTLDIILIAVPLGIVGSRIFHVLTHPDDYFFAGADPWAVLRIWEGGIALFGGLIGGTVGAWLGCRRTGVRLWTFADALAPGLLLAQTIGRLGNWFNQELYGRPTTLPWGLQIDQAHTTYPPGILFHPTFLYEMAWNGLGVLVLLWLGRRLTAGTGRLFGVYLAWYAAGRVVWESLRIDPSEVILGLRTNHWTAILAILIGLALVLVQAQRHRTSEAPVYGHDRERARTPDALAEPRP